MNLTVGGTNKSSATFCVELYAFLVANLGFSVRQFRPYTICEAVFQFTPSSKFHGFRVLIPETFTRKSLTERAAYKLAVKFALKELDLVLPASGN